MGTLRHTVVVTTVSIAVLVAGSFALATRTPRRPAAGSSGRASAAAEFVALAPVGTVPPTTPTTLATPATPSIDGARGAALAYLGLSERVVGIDIESAVAAQREAATSAAAPALVTELRQRLAALAAAFPGGGVRYRVGALAVRAEAVGAGRATVAIWYVGVLSAPGVAPYEQWRLSRYDLVWERGAWRVAGEATGPGPRPSAPPGPDPVTAGGLEATLGGFTSAVAP